MSLTSTATSGPLWVALPLALAAGAVSFASPCVVPLVPGYLAYLAGLVGADVSTAVPTAPAPARVATAAPASSPSSPPASSPAAAASSPAVAASSPASSSPGPQDSCEPRSSNGPSWTVRSKVAGAAALFVAGFTVVFVAGLGAVVWLADTLLANQDLLQRLGGVVTVAMGLVFVGLVPALQRDIRPHWVPRAGLLGAPLLGATFGLGWTPCLGPTLTGVVALASGVGGSTRGLVLVLAYCAGLGAPFVLIASGAQRAVRLQGWLRRHTRAIQLGGGVLLIAVGLALASGLWAGLVAVLRGPIAGFATPI